MNGDRNPELQGGSVAWRQKNVAMPPSLRLFGTPALVSDDAVHRLAVPAKAIALLGLLAAEPGKALDRAHLASALYPDETDADARTATRRQLHVLTKVLPEGAFVLTKNTVKLSPLLVSDVAAFLSDDEGAIANAVAARSGDFCAGVFDDALQETRDRFDRRFADLLTRLAKVEHANGNAAAATRILEQLVTLDPLDEGRVRELMTARMAQGDRSGALREYNSLVLRLRNELEVDPEHETAALFQRILFSVDATSTPHNLHASSTSFVGRERELAALSSAIETRRLTTIVGPGGVGKTRLAARLAFDAIESFADGVWFIDLSALTDGARLYEHLLASIRTRTALGQDSADTLVAELLNKRALLVIDNCEHLFQPVAELARELLDRTTCTLLCTSRRKLSLDEEHLFPLEPLDVPEGRSVRAVDIRSFSGARLFAERAVTVSPSLRITDDNAPAVCEIVRRVHGLPLAIEIVAARANMLTVDGMLKRLSESLASTSRGTDARHTTVEAAIAWSYALLSVREQKLFSALSIFSGGWDIEAAEVICSQNGDDVFSTLSELVESSLVRSERIEDEIRYSLFELTRDFAAARRASDSGASTLPERHARYYAERASDYSQHFKSSREVAYYHKIDADYANFSAAAQWAAKHDPALAAQIVKALWRYAIFSGRMSDIDPLLRAVFASKNPIDAHLLAHVHLAVGMIEKELMRQDQALHHLSAALSLFREAGDERGEADALYALGIVNFNHGDQTAARGYYEQCLALQTRAGDAAGIAGTTANLGAVAHVLGDLEDAAAHYRRALAGFQATGNERGIAYAYRSLSVVYQDLDRNGDALEAAERSVAAYEKLGDRSRLADGLLTMGNVLALINRLPESFAAFARAFGELIDAPTPQFEALAFLGYADAARRSRYDLDAARAAAKGLQIIREREIMLGIPYQRYLDEMIDELRHHLGDEQFEAAQIAGEQRSIQDYRIEADHHARASAPAPVITSSAPRCSPDENQNHGS